MAIGRLSCSIHSIGERISELWVCWNVDLNIWRNQLSSYVTWDWTNNFLVVLTTKRFLNWMIRKNWKRVFRMQLMVWIRWPLFLSTEGENVLSCVVDTWNCKTWNTVLLNATHQIIELSAQSPGSHFWEGVETKQTYSLQFIRKDWELQKVRNIWKKLLRP